MTDGENSSVFTHVDPDEHIYRDLFNSCKYYSLHEYNNLLQSENSKFKLKILNFNIRSFAANGLSFELFLDSLVQKPQIIVLTETWNNDRNVDFCRLDNYRVYHEHRGGPRGGGVSIFCSKDLISEKFPGICHCDSNIETCAVKIKLVDICVTIVGVYRPPSGSLSEFYSFISANLNFSNSRSSIAILAGDMNINLNSGESNSFIEYAAILHSRSFLPAITIPTRFTPNYPLQNSSNLDHIWFNFKENISSGVLNMDVTDHCPVFIHIIQNTTEINNNERIRIMSRPFSDDSLGILASKLLRVDWNILNELNCDVGTETFCKILNDLYCQSFPVKIKYISKKRSEKPWITQSLKRLMQLKSEYFANFKQGLISRTTNNVFRNRVNTAITRARKNYYSDSFNNSSNTGKTWDLIKSLIGNGERKQLVQKLVIGDQTYNSEMDIADKFNEFFVSIARDLDNDLPSGNISPYFSMSPPPPNSFFLRPVSELDCQNIIKTLKNTKSHLDTMPVTIFKKITPYIVTPLSKLINMSFSSGTFPSIFKTSIITPVYKSGNSECPSNYRPISTIPYISKIFEKCICVRLVSYFEKFSFFTDVQFGFRRGMSTSDALLKFVDHIFKCLNDKNHHISLLIDFAKAFDTISHNILLGKLERYGIRGPPLQLLKSFITNREQKVRVGKEVSTPRFSHYGIAQGSTLGPILFLIYINDFPKVTSILKTILFADDSNFSFSHNNYENMVAIINGELKHIQQWTVANRLTINVEKTKMMLFTNRSISNNPPPVVLGECEISKSDCVTYLGVKVDSNLTFSTHIGHVTGKIAKITGILYKIRENLTMNARLSVYYALAYPYFIYCVLIYCGTYRTHLSELEVQQKRLIRTLCNLGYNEHTSASFHRFKILKLYDIYRYHLCIYMFKNRNFSRFSTTHNRNTRNRNRLIPEFQRLTRSQFSVSFMAPTVFNSLPTSLKELDKIHIFKRKLKQFFIDQYI